MTREEHIELLCTYLAAAEVPRQSWTRLNSGRERVAGAGVDAPVMRDFDLAEPLWALDDVDDPGLDAPAFPVGLRLARGHDLTVAHTTNDGALALTRVRVCHPHEVRGRVQFAKYVVRQWRAVIERSGDCVDGYANLYLTSNNGSRWRAPGGELPAQMEDERGRLMAVVPGILWARARTWRVAIGFESYPRIDLSTSALGVRELFALRDIPNGARRRAALRHWVSGHWRRKHADDEASAVTWVHQHLRGAVEFTWNGMRARIGVPSKENEAEYSALVRSQQVTGRA